MKKGVQYISFLLLFAIIVSISWQTATIAHFYANQDEIEQEFCENKNQPQLNCHGKCHLEKKLSITKDNPTDKQQQFTSGILIFQGFENLASVSLYEFESSNLNFFDNSSRLQSGAISGLLDPPELS